MAGSLVVVVILLA